MLRHTNLVVRFAFVFEAHPHHEDVAFRAIEIRVDLPQRFLRLEGSVEGSDQLIARIGANVRDVLEPNPSPSQTPQAIAIIFLMLPPNSTPITSVFV